MCSTRAQLAAESAETPLDPWHGEGRAGTGAAFLPLPSPLLLADPAHRLSSPSRAWARPSARSTAAEQKGAFKTGLSLPKPGLLLEKPLLP